MTDSKSTFFPYGRQWVTEEDAHALLDVARSDYLTTGPEVTAFEADLKQAANVAHAIAVNSGTAALHAAYRGVGLQAGGTLVTSPLTFAATANAALYLQAKVVFADVDPSSGNLSPEATDAAIAEEGHVDVICAVDFGGSPADYDRLNRLAESHGARLVSDAAHSLGGTYQGRPVGTLADASTFSFHPVKAITTAEGGAVVTNDSGVAERASVFRTHGVVRDPARIAEEGPWFYEQRDLGFNYRISDLQCALGRRQLRRLGEFVRRRQEIARFYSEALSDIEGIELPTVPAGNESAWHLYPIRVRDAARRRALFEELRKQRLGVQVHYIPVYWHPFYQNLGYKRGLCPVAEDLYQRLISLPMYPRMTGSDMREVAERVRDAARATL